MVTLRPRLPQRPTPATGFDVWDRSRPTSAVIGPAGPCSAYLERCFQQAGGVDVVAAAAHRARSHPRPTEEAHYQYWAPLTHGVRTWLAQRARRASQQIGSKHPMPTPPPTAGGR